MDRDALGRAGIQLPVLPTVVLGGLPAGRDWPAILVRVGVDVVSSGVDPDTDATLAAVVAAVPYRPVKATGVTARLTRGAWLVEDDHAPAGAFAIDPAEVVTGVTGAGDHEPNAIASGLLPLVRDRPADWWVAARDLSTGAPNDVEQALVALVEGVRMVRLYLAKQQFDV